MRRTSRGRRARLRALRRSAVGSSPIALARRLAFALALVVALAGCAAPGAHPRDFRFAIDIDPTSLSPLAAFDQDQIALDLLWTQTLVGLDARNRFVPVLATRVPSRENGDVSPDGLRITYHLRPDARFADGVPLTSADVAFTYRALFDPANAVGSLEVYRRVASLSTPDRHTVVVHLRAPWGAAVHVLFAQADFAFGILPAHAFANTTVTGSAWDRAPFGTGPFRVASWRRGEEVVLERNPYFRPRPKLDRIEVKFIPNQIVGFNALRTHDVDATELDPDNVAQAVGLARIRVDRLPENGLEALYLQTTGEPTNDPRVRRAIALALDVPALRKPWHGAYPRAASVFPPPLVSWPHVEPRGFPHDLAAARRDLDAAGWRLRGGTRFKDGKPLELSLAIDSARVVANRLAILIQAQLADVGATVTIKAYPSNVFTAFSGPVRTGRFSLSPTALIGGSDPEQSLALACSQATNGGENYARYCSPAFEKLYAAQRVATSDAERDRDFDAIAALVRADVPLVPLFDMVYVQGVDARVTRYERNMLRFPVRPELWDVSPR